MRKVLPEALDQPSLLLGVLTFGFMEAWFLVNFWDPYLFNDQMPIGMFLNQASVIQAVAFTFTMLILALLPKIINACLRTSIMAAICVALSCSTAIMWYFGFSAVEPDPAFNIAFFISSALPGLLSAFMTMVIAAQLSNVNLRQFASYVLLGEAVAAIIFFVLLFVFVQLRALFVSLLPLAVWAVYSCYNRKQEFQRSPSADVIQNQAPKIPFRSLKQYNKKSVRILGGFLVCTILIGLINEASRILYDHVVTAATTATAYRLTQVVMVCVVVAFCIVIYLLTRRPNNSWFDWLYKSTFALLILSSLLLPLALLFPEADGAYLAFSSLGKVSYECFFVFIWILAKSFLGKSSELLFIFPLSRLFWSAGQLLGMNFAASFSSYLTGSSAYVYALVAVLLTAVSFVVFCPESLLTTLLLGSSSESTSVSSEETSAQFANDETFENRCRTLSLQHNISAREQDVLLLLAQGRNTAYIQGALCLSRSTVSTHRQHIYAKLNIHTQQELIALIQDEMQLRNGSL